MAGELHLFGVREDTIKRTSKGFSFIEVMLVVVILGILSAIAIPALIGQKKNAELVGDAQQNTKSLQMMLETRKADTGLYGPVGEVNTWTPKTDGTIVTTTTTTNLAPLFATKGSTKLTYTLTILGGGLTYTLAVKDDRPGKSGAPVYQTDETGKQVYP